MQTVVGLFRSVSEANQVRQALINQGYNGGDVTVIDQSESDYQSGNYGASDYSSNSFGTGAGSGVSGLTGDNAGITGEGRSTSANYGGTATATGTQETGVGAKIKHFFEGLSGHDEHTHNQYTQGVSGGGALVAVKVNENEVDRAAEVLRQNGASDIEGDDASSYNAGSTTRTGASDYSATGTTGRTGDANVVGEQVIPVVQEELVVGKRQVERGGVRVYAHVVSEAVSESVNLHDERVLVDRRAVDRPATDADFTNAGPIEVRAMGEEAVVGKTGRVVEEVVVGKTASDRTETVQDSVRHTEVDVEPVSADTTTGSRNTTNTTTGTKY